MDADIIDLTWITISMVALGGVLSWALTRAFMQRSEAAKLALVKAEYGAAGYELARYSSPGGSAHPVLKALSGSDWPCSDTADALNRIYAIKEENAALRLLKRSMSASERVLLGQPARDEDAKYTIAQVRATVAAALGATVATGQPLEADLIGRFITLQARLGITHDASGHSGIGASAATPGFGEQLASVCDAVERMLADRLAAEAEVSMSSVTDLMREGIMPFAESVAAPVAA